MLINGIMYAKKVKDLVSGDIVCIGGKLRVVDNIKLKKDDVYNDLYSVASTDMFRLICFGTSEIDCISKVPEFVYILTKIKKESGLTEFLINEVKRNVIDSLSLNSLDFSNVLYSGVTGQYYSYNLDKLREEAETLKSIVIDDKLLEVESYQNSKIMFINNKKDKSFI